MIQSGQVLKNQVWLLETVHHWNDHQKVHEMHITASFHHCFSPTSNASGANLTQVETRLLGIDVIVGRQGDSCDDVCKSRGQLCVMNKLSLLNQCDV
ncbi:hypothetical protein F2Q69_00049506 [Brassica cretica]|uniref:Uncharacterized protein n=1 Tax=Brassica cretica TaxID=69181 RepID=A0A8S9PTK7_BRACR|nr:hypothetical protein F2Q69_00049506 [Brassica cretica]